MKDLVRFTAQFTNCARMKQFVDKLRGGVRDKESGGEEALTSTSVALAAPPRGVFVVVSVLSMKNKYASPSALGYRDVNLSLEVRLADGRPHVCELQVNLEDMLVAKEFAHSFYEEVSDILLFLFLFLDFEFNFLHLIYWSCLLSLR